MPKRDILLTKNYVIDCLHLIDICGTQLVMLASLYNFTMYIQIFSLVGGTSQRRENICIFTSICTMKYLYHEQ